MLFCNFCSIFYDRVKLCELLDVIGFLILVFLFRYTVSSYKINELNLCILFIRKRNIRLILST